MPLESDHQAVCPGCGALVFVYLSPIGEPVTLDSHHGGYVIDGRRRAYLTQSADGYRGHICRTAGANVADDEFSWL